MRALAILSVVAWHYLGIGDGPASTPWRIFEVGRSGVDLFFVLSGYLITGILLANANSLSFFSTFYSRRGFRILPIYAVMLVIYLIGRQLGGSAPILFGGPLPWWSYAIGLQNIWMTIRPELRRVLARRHMVACDRGTVLSDLSAGHLSLAEPGCCRAC